MNLENLVENLTSFRHKDRPSWGIGVLRKKEGNYLIIEFEASGTKRFAKQSINKYLIEVKNSVELVQQPVDYRQEQTTSEGDKVEQEILQQYNGEGEIIGGKKVVPAFESKKPVSFNESYCVIGELLQVPRIHAMYDLTIIGDVTVEDCVINGSGTIVGNACITNLSCNNVFVCKGELNSESIYVGSDIYADSIRCDKLICDGNVFVKTTVDINEACEIAKSIIACEGIMGAGKFSCHRAIANEYFEFDGECEGKILEIGDDT